MAQVAATYQTSTSSLVSCWWANRGGEVELLGRMNVRIQSHSQWPGWVVGSRRASGTKVCQKPKKKAGLRYISFSGDTSDGIRSIGPIPALMGIWAAELPSSIHTLLRESQPFLSSPEVESSVSNPIWRLEPTLFREHRNMNKHKCGKLTLFYP